MAQIVLVPAIVTTASVLPFAAELASQLERNDAIELDLAAVTDADVSFLQLVCAARRQAEHDGNPAPSTPRATARFCNCSKTALPRSMRSPHTCATPIHDRRSSGRKRPPRSDGLANA